MMKQKVRQTVMTVQAQAVVKVDELVIEEILKAAGLESLD